METFSSQNIAVMFLSLGILLGVALLLGEMAQRLLQPAVLGDLVAGVLVGPTLLGTLSRGGTVRLSASALTPEEDVDEALERLARVLA